MNKIFIIFFAGILLGGCGNFDEDINVDPNNPIT